MMMRRWLAFALALPVFSQAVVGDQKPPDVVEAAQSFLRSLDKDSHRRAVKPFGDDTRTHWRYTPASREGVSWGDLDPHQTAKAVLLIKETLSNLGYKRVQAVRTLEAVLERLENNPVRDEDGYYFTFFGAPDKTARWGWRYEGHHISLNFTFDGERMVSSTPQFFGANPAEVTSGDSKGLRMLGREEDVAIHFLSTLSDAQKKKAVIANNAPSDIFTAENRTAARQSNAGLSYGDMTPAQQTDLRGLITLNARAQGASEDLRRMSAIKSAGFEQIVFAWMGATDRGGPHYYRIQGPTFLIEFDNIQNRANHIHLVWRDFDGDFGRDVLKEHYEHSGLEHGHDH